MRRLEQNHQRESHTHRDPYRDKRVKIHPIGLIGPRGDNSSSLTLSFLFR